ncbi:Protein of uncharacterised function (DUF3071) [Corynebacterium kutscheri]|uniref:Protein of uncharacterized function (DUF3071) n=1 Tax=Corynebacterium kutscheri TaxID=35755 RepID=A0AB38VP77_9CORY|nr:septation protein SepH [Corynebacterium kutscheri]VEH04416.1 Protein of uncharacterised function (DUF3071) [Corynebacterium kutscheri]VEH80293.1 Protein of uncharacterised function (DUF3071) [Corynebacterium kutscheri]
MRELILVPGESTRTSLVFHERDDVNKQFFLAVDDSLRSTLLGEETTTHTHPVATDTTTTDTAAEKKHTDTPESSVTEVEKTVTPATQFDPRQSNPLKMRPREIQERIRGGASIEEVAELNDVVPSRIETYAHPILLERARIAELAKKSHPVRDDGPAKLTLWEILATAFAARDIDLSQTTWDAYRDPSQQWIVKISWKAGLSENEAEYSYHRHGTGATTAVARNGAAADLIDPDFIQPVRKLSSLSHQDQVAGIDALIGTRPHSIKHTRDDLPVVQDAAQDSPTPTIAATPAEQPTESVVEAEGEDFLQHPDNTTTQSKRRRKAITPHWEDVLLGVRTNTKRPRS